MTFKVKDRFFHKAKEEGFAARSVYKLKELNQKGHFIRSGHTVVDLGCAPGSWSQWLSQELGPQGHVIGFDLTPVDLKLPNVHFYQANLLNTDIRAFLVDHGHPPTVDGVVSDMAPKTTGIRDVDQSRSLELSEMAFRTAQEVLKPGGYFICKIFQSKDSEAFVRTLKGHFRKVTLLKPESTRSRSYEVFFMGLHYRP